MTKKRWAAKDKSRIVMESLTTATPVVDICKKYGLSTGGGPIRGPSDNCPDAVTARRLS